MQEVKKQKLSIRVTYAVAVIDEFICLKAKEKGSPHGKGWPIFALVGNGVCLYKDRNTEYYGSTSERIASTVNSRSHNSLESLIDDVSKTTGAVLGDCLISPK